MKRITIRVCVLAVALGAQGTVGAANATIRFEKQKGKLLIHVNDAPFATYRFDDPTITRPYFAHLRAPNGVQVTRNHPPKKDDLADHATYHPGLFLAFGDVSGNDYWRLKAKVVFDCYVQEPQAKDDRGSFAVRHRYLDAKSGKVVCTETFRCEVLIRPGGYFLLWDSTFSPATSSIYFGDQEEMGLGVRLATSVAVVKRQGGRILDSEGRKNEKQIWGKQAAWCDYSGKADGKRVGVTLMPHPKNFRRSWFHARDYGLLEANPFGRNAFTRGEKSKIGVKKGEALRLRFGVLIHGDKPARKNELHAAYATYLRLAQ